MNSIERDFEIGHILIQSRMEITVLNIKLFPLLIAVLAIFGVWCVLVWTLPRLANQAFILFKSLVDLQTSHLQQQERTGAKRR